MAETSQDQSNAMSRRTVVHGALYAAGACTLIAPVTRANAAKMAQAAAGYQNAPKGTQQCDNCLLFQAPDSCQLVDGTINPSGWCRFYAKKAG
jgi:High potential iron-sulfur protein